MIMVGVVMIMVGVVIFTVGVVILTINGMGAGRTFFDTHMGVNLLDEGGAYQDEILF